MLFDGSASEVACRDIPEWHQTRLGICLGFLQKLLGRCKLSVSHLLATYRQGALAMEYLPREKALRAARLQDNIRVSQAHFGVTHLQRPDRS